MQDSRGYQDAKKAADAEIKSIWSGWLGAGIMWVVASMIWRNDFMFWGLFVGGALSTVLCIALTLRVSSAELRARKRTLEVHE
ncbi:hypothetical protein [Streptomyces decoyicus]